MKQFTHQIQNPLGPLVAIGCEKKLHFLGFQTRRNLKKELERFAPLQAKKTPPLALLEEELSSYFANKTDLFNTSLEIRGTSFQKDVWKALLRIPFGKTCSYLSIAEAIGKPKANRAVTSAIGINPFTILIPCHRVLRSNGDLGGYNGGVEKKQWLLEFENALFR